MKLYDNWKEILRRSWSLRFIILAGVLSVIEAGLPLFEIYIDPLAFRIALPLAVGAAFIARLVAQRGI